MAGYEKLLDNRYEEPSFQKASLPLKIGYVLESAAMLLRGLGLKQRQQDIVDDTLAFCDVNKSEWGVHLASSAKRTLENNKFNKIIELPRTANLILTKNYLEEWICVLTEFAKKK